MESSKTHSIVKDGKKLTWFVEKLWQAAADLEVYDYPIESFEGFGEDIWFGDQVVPTVERVLEHHQKIAKASFKYPIIVSEDGTVMDGVHRICKARLEGRSNIPAVRFSVTPQPDFTAVAL